eukprot:CAMPEP_0180407054 /NCGR_PEP_ID=MMETSP0989-20121125/41511_1 /TAXON_ID=697907 /ORGANISM="non described non described, Strain CCMP2293" /LENGTH=272 /DNA_ID=CAMNT_0022410845 /DNA_START=46 /DNA_END=865 /DNA_ORIENTATION=+
MDGRAHVHYNATFSWVKFEVPRAYSREEIQALVAKVQKAETSYYRATDTELYRALEDVQRLDGMAVGILGSLEPWYEAVAIAYGAATVTTVEYNQCKYQHPKVRTKTVDQYWGEADEDRTGEFDVVLSISSVEHDGLGRYGDPIDPDGDLKAMEKLRRMTKPGGRLFLAVPVGPDTVVWNLHRVYGKARLPLLLRGWTLLGTYGYSPTMVHLEAFRHQHHQPVFLLENTDPGDAGESLAWLVALEEENGPETSLVRDERGERGILVQKLVLS